MLQLYHKEAYLLLTSQFYNQVIFPPPRSDQSTIACALRPPPCKPASPHPRCPSFCPSATHPQSFARVELLRTPRGPFMRRQRAISHSLPLRSLPHPGATASFHTARPPALCSRHPIASAPACRWRDAAETLHSHPRPPMR